MSSNHQDKQMKELKAQVRKELQLKISERNSGKYMALPKEMMRLFTPACREWIRRSSS